MARADHEYKQVRMELCGVRGGGGGCCGGHGSSGDDAASFAPKVQGYGEASPPKKKKSNSQRTSLTGRQMKRRRLRRHSKRQPKGLAQNHRHRHMHMHTHTREGSAEGARSTLPAVRHVRTNPQRDPTASPGTAAADPVATAAAAAVAAAAAATTPCPAFPPRPNPPPLTPDWSILAVTLLLESPNLSGRIENPAIQNGGDGLTQQKIKGNPKENKKK
ncbi:hypothetical protein RUM43_002426 [Polyplax serrata]|uniref:Uncharacterized protein n=1 Tax=Polyplax serrata TaxID=468196 RepID=A0AAN8S974_POLSC